jgi:hypothetical protein
MKSYRLARLAAKYGPEISLRDPLDRLPFAIRRRITSSTR